MTHVEQDIDGKDRFDKLSAIIEPDLEYVKFFQDNLLLIEKSIDQIYSNLSAKENIAKGEFERQAKISIQLDFTNNKLGKNPSFQDLCDTIAKSSKDIGLKSDSGANTNNFHRLKSNSAVPFFSLELFNAVTRLTDGEDPLFQFDSGSNSTLQDTFLKLSNKDQQARNLLEKGKKVDRQNRRYAETAKELGISEEALNMRIKKIHTILRTFYPISFKHYYQAQHHETAIKTTKYLQSDLFDFSRKEQIYLNEKLNLLKTQNKPSSIVKLANVLNSNTEFRDSVLTNEELSLGTKISTEILRWRVLRPISRKIQEVDNMLRSENVFLLRTNGVDFQFSINTRGRVENILLDLQSTYDSNLLSNTNKKFRAKQRLRFNQKAA